jgi:hypothetical protein
MVPLPSAAIAQAAWKGNRSTSQARYTNLHARMPKRIDRQISLVVIFITDTDAVSDSSEELSLGVAQV